MTKTVIASEWTMRARAIAAALQADALCDLDFRIGAFVDQLKDQSAAVGDAHLPAAVAERIKPLLYDRDTPRAHHALSRIYGQLVR